MADYLEGPDGLKVRPVQLRTPDVHLLLARMGEPDVQLGDDVWYIVTHNGMAVGLPPYYQLHELSNLLEDLGLSLADFHEPS